MAAKFAKINADQIVSDISTTFVVLHNTFNQSWSFSWIQQSVIPYNGIDYNCDKLEDLRALTSKIGKDVILTVFQRWDTSDSIFSKKQLFAACAISCKLFDVSDFTEDVEAQKTLKSFAKWADEYYHFSKASRTMPIKTSTPKGTGNKAKTQVKRRSSKK